MPVQATARVRWLAMLWPRFAPCLTGGVGRFNMAIRIISFVGGALFGAGGAILVFHFVEQSAVHWGITALAAIVMGLLAALFGRKFWDTAISIWP